MAPKFALFTKGSKLALNQGFQNRFLVTTVSRQALDIHVNIILPFPTYKKNAADNFESGQTCEKSLRLNY